MAFIAPAGTPLTLTEIATSLIAGWQRPATSARLHEVLCGASASSHAWAFVSGRAAMTVALRAMALMAGVTRSRVIIPAYTCYSVPAAVERAGLVPVPCDIDPRTLSLDLDHLARIDFGRVLAVVTASLFGVPNALTEVEKVARDSGVFLLDDAAQALGARLAGRAVGSFGDVGVYSFDKGKNISTMQGGALVARPGPLTRVLEAEFKRLPAPRLRDTVLTTAKLLPYALFLRPGRYEIARRMPLLGLGQTRYDRGYPISKFSRGLAGLALHQLGEIDSYQSARIRTARALRHALEGVPGLRFVELLPQSQPVFPRFPVFASSRSARHTMLTALNQAGIGATSFYPKALVDVPEVVSRMPLTLGEYPGARLVADTMMTLPTHRYCPPGMPQRIRDVIVDAAVR